MSDMNLLPNGAPAVIVPDKSKMTSEKYNELFDDKTSTFKVDAVNKAISEGETIPTLSLDKTVTIDNKFFNEFMNSFKYLIFLLASSILIGTFVGEGALNWFLGLILAGLVLFNYKLLERWNL
jgi:hypothetical protein